MEKAKYINHIRQNLEGESDAHIIEFKQPEPENTVVTFDNKSYQKTA